MAELDILWAGWRSQYVQGLGQEEAEECIFCRLPGQDDEEGLIIRRGEHAFAVLNRYPYASGHLMVGPYRHVAGPGDLDDDERSEMWSLLALGEEVLAARLQSRRLQHRRQSGACGRARGCPATSISTSFPDGQVTPIS